MPVEFAAMAAAYEALGAQRQEAPWESLLDGACREDWGGFAQSGALRGLAATRRRDALEWLMQNVDYGRLPRRARPAAVNALADIGAVQERSAREPVVEKVLDLLRDPEPRVRKAASNGLKTLEARNAISALEQYRRSLPHQERVAVDQIVKEMRAAEQPRQASFEKQMEELREKHRKLEERVRKLEDDAAISQR